MRRSPKPAGLRFSAGRKYALALLLGACAHAPGSLEGTSWQLAAFRSGDGTLTTPDDGSKYTVQFQTDGVVTARIDCNRARGAWKSAGPGQIEFAATMAATRAQCPPGSLHDLIMKQLPYVRSYTIKNGRLYLSLMADGGTFEFISLH